MCLASLSQFSFTPDSTVNCTMIGILRYFVFVRLRPICRERVERHDPEEGSPTDQR